MGLTSLAVRGIELGTGIPKICVPVVARQYADILSKADEIAKQKPDMLELRIDWFSEVSDWERVYSLLKELRDRIGDMVLLFTFRTKQEGGEASISVEDYQRLCENACRSGMIDLLDVEAYMEEGLLTKLCDIAHDNGVFVVASSHDFEKTPDEKEMTSRLHFMEQQGADICKLAVMPQQKRDVLALLSATLAYRETGGDRPVITMSMAGQGLISRLTGEIFDSAVTFAAVGEVSAPGQLPIKEVRQMLDIIHNHL